MQIAVLADVHGNLPALRAVLAALDREPVDAIVVAGDVCGGPLVRAALELLEARPEPLHWIAGNSERETVAVFDGGEIPDGPPGRADAWSAGQLDRRWRDALAGWPIAVTLDGVCFCHGSPRRDDEILTRGTPDPALAEALADVPAALVVGGHTHQQMIRRVHARLVYANAGSVGLPYEGNVGAFWMVVADGVPGLRETSYDHAAALAELRASGFPEFEDHFDGSLVSTVDPDWVTAFFEHRAGRRPHPGEPRLAG
ncbi:MAG TPA: metallophosphoesterase family protein [Solirubrobacteraceae bacterium]|nr:metallophosphoesterase family protein [Solirubrobacteraceae bacterium]